jgi:hypothetical protein
VAVAIMKEDGRGYHWQKDEYFVGGGTMDEGDGARESKRR